MKPGTGKRFALGAATTANRIGEIAHNIAGAEYDGVIDDAFGEISVFALGSQIIGMLPELKPVDWERYREIQRVIDMGLNPSDYFNLSGTNLSEEQFNVYYHRARLGYDVAKAKVRGDRLANHHDWVQMHYRVGWMEQTAAMEGVPKVDNLRYIAAVVGNVASGLEAARATKDRLTRKTFRQVANYGKDPGKNWRIHRLAVARDLISVANVLGEQQADVLARAGEESAYTWLDPNDIGNTAKAVTWSLYTGYLMAANTGNPVLAGQVTRAHDSAMGLLRFGKEDCFADPETLDEIQPLREIGSGLYVDDTNQFRHDPGLAKTLYTQAHRGSWK